MKTKSARPQIKYFFGVDATVETVHKAYLNNAELFNYAQALDRYIDELEDEDQEVKVDAIAFAEWIKINAYHSNGDWYLHKSMSGEIYSESQLYLLYKDKNK